MLPRSQVRCFALQGLRSPWTRPSHVRAFIDCVLQRSSDNNSFDFVALCRLVDLSGALRYEGVKFDKCVLEEKLGDVLLPDDQDVNVTADPTHLPLPQPTQFGALSPEGLTVITIFIITYSQCIHFN